MAVTKVQTLVDLDQTKPKTGRSFTDGCLLDHARSEAQRDFFEHKPPKEMGSPGIMTLNQLKSTTRLGCAATFIYQNTKTTRISQRKKIVGRILLGYDSRHPSAFRLRPVLHAAPDEVEFD